MRGDRRDLWILASRVRDGDSSATTAFVREFERQLVRMIRRHVHSGQAICDVDRRIAAAISRLFEEVAHARGLNRTGLIQEVTRRICQATLETIQHGRSVMETVVDS